MTATGLLPRWVVYTISYSKNKRMIKVVISGYGRMGHNVELVLKDRGIECAGATDDISSFDI